MALEDESQVSFNATSVSHLQCSKHSSPRNVSIAAYRLSNHLYIQMLSIIDLIETKLIVLRE